ncbi:hypothetical protein QJQ45_016216 [Haematococcus lacustris]|nr:hypothetical protein QJQ45_016216 [Haematococcus lacustris]
MGLFSKSHPYKRHGGHAARCACCTKSTQAGSTGWVEIHVEGEAAFYRSGCSHTAIGQVTAQMSEVITACDNLEPALIPLAHRTCAEAAAAAHAVCQRLRGQESASQLQPMPRLSSTPTQAHAQPGPAHAPCPHHLPDQPPSHPLQSQLQGSSQQHPALPALSILTRPATNPVTSPAVEQQPIIHTTEEQDEQTMPPSMPKQQQDWATARCAFRSLALTCTSPALHQPCPDLHQPCPDLHQPCPDLHQPCLPCSIGDLHQSLPPPSPPSPAPPSLAPPTASPDLATLAPDWAAELSGLLLNTTFTFQVMVVAVVGQQIIMPELGWAATGGGMHAFEVARHVEALSDSLLGALVDQDFPELFSRAQELVPPAQWEVVKLELVHLITQHIDAMFKYLGAHGKVYLQLPHLLPAMASSDATYAAHAARRVLEEDAANRKQWEAWEEQQQEERQQDHGNRKRMRRPLPPQSCNPAEYDLFNTISIFRADIEAMAANEACSPRLFIHLVHFFGAAPASNAHVESALQHTKHGHGSKQGLAALLGTVIAKTDPASFRAMDAVDLQPRMNTLSSALSSVPKQLFPQAQGVLPKRLQVASKLLAQTEQRTTRRKRESKQMDKIATLVIETAQYPAAPAAPMGLSDQLTLGYQQDPAFTAEADHSGMYQDTDGLWRISGYRWEHVSMDLVTKLPTGTHGYDDICVIVDRLSKMVHFVPCKEAMNAMAFTRLFINNVFRPQSDGQTERYNRVLEEMLRHYISPTQADWPDHLALAEFAVNNSWQESIYSTPFFLNTGQSPVTPGLRDLPDGGRCPSAHAFATWWKEGVAHARRHMADAQARYKRHANTGLKDVEFEVGAQVLLNTRNLRIKTGKVRRFVPRYVGPFVVEAKINANAYRLTLPANMSRLHPVFHVSLLKKYSGSDVGIMPPPVEWMDETPVYYVERLLDHRYVRAGKAGEFLVQWEGYDASFNTWEPRANLTGCDKLLAEYNAIHSMPMFDQKRDDKHWDDECLTLMCSFAPDSVMQLCTLGKKLSVKMLNEYCKASNRRVMGMLDMGRNARIAGRVYILGCTSGHSSSPCVVHTMTTCGGGSMWHGAISSQGAIGSVLGCIPDGVDVVLSLSAFIDAFSALGANFKPKIAMGHPGPRRRAALAHHEAIRAKLSSTELPALETALATPQQSSRGAITWGHKRPRTCLGRGAQQQLSMDQQELQGAQHQLAVDQQQLQDAQRQVALDQQQLQGAQHQLAVDQQLLQDAQRQVALDQQQLQGAQHQLAVDLKQLQGTQHQLAQALEQMQNDRTGLERSELLLRQHMDACMRLLRTISGSRAMHAMFFPADGVAPMWSETACACVRHMGSKPQQCMCHGASTLSSIPMFGRVTLASDKKEDAECLRLLHARAPHIASAHMTLNVHLLKEYARECLGWKGKRLTQKKPLLRADILEHLRWEQEMEEDQLAEVGVDEADEM